MIDTGKLDDKFIIGELEFPERRTAAALSLRRMHIAEASRANAYVRSTTGRKDFAIVVSASVLRSSYISTIKRVPSATTVVVGMYPRIVQFRDRVLDTRRESADGVRSSGNESQSPFLLLRPMFPDI